jgi:glycerol kinase
MVSIANKEYKQIYPKPGYVEHDPAEIFSSQYGVLAEALTRSGVAPGEIAAIGITNQRETTILWDKATGKPVCNAIVWQCRRTYPYCEELKARGLEPYIKETTGLLIDAYFSATKIMWILDNIPGVREKAEAGDILFGTVDTWLIWNLSARKAHVTDYTNASRTMLFNINTMTWDERLLKEFNIPRAILPEVKYSSGVCATANVLGRDIPISGIAGDQQAALFGQQCFSKGEVKNTYGTGCFLLMNTGDTPVTSNSGLITTIASCLDGKVSYALEGSVFTGGAVVQWLRDELKILNTAAESEKCAQSVNDNAGVYIVPAFSGLGAPYWDMCARGAIFGITRGSGKNHIVRAALESIAYQAKAVLDAMQADTGIEIKALNADGGASTNNFLMQFQSDILDIEVLCPGNAEATALGAAYLAGLATGVWKSMDELRERRNIKRRFTPNMDAEKRAALLAGWAKAVDRSLRWEE